MYFHQLVKSISSINRFAKRITFLKLKTTSINTLVHYNKSISLMFNNDVSDFFLLVL